MTSGPLCRSAGLAASGTKWKSAWFGITVGVVRVDRGMQVGRAGRGIAALGVTIVVVVRLVLIAGTRSIRFEFGRRPTGVAEQGVVDRRPGVLRVAILLPRIVSRCCRNLPTVAASRSERSSVCLTDDGPGRREIGMLHSTVSIRGVAVRWVSPVPPLITPLMVSPSVSLTGFTRPDVCFRVAQPMVF